MIEPKEIIKSRRKTIALVIDHDGELIVRAPFYATQKDVMYFIQEKQEWLEQKSLEMKEKMKNTPTLSWSDGEEILYMGKSCKIRRGDFKQFHFDGESFWIPNHLEPVMVMTKWYRNAAAGLIAPRVEELAKIMEEEPAGIRITSARTRWGSCSYDNHLNFSWRLMMCPKSVIDYVIIHELSHIQHKDHSKAFWKRVEKFDPHYRQHDSWLSDHQRLMEVIKGKGDET